MKHLIHKKEIILEIKINSKYLYCLHDEDINSFIIKTGEPNSVTVINYLNDDFSFLSDIKTDKIIGFQFFNFFSNWLYKDRQMYELWKDYKMEKHFSQWKRESWDTTIIVYLKREMFKNYDIILTKENNEK